MCKNAQMASGEELNWDDLRYFLRAAESKSLAGAARAAHVEHTTIGRRLSALEQAFGAPLVLRGRDGLQLTQLGEQLVPLVTAVERAVNAVRDLVASERSRVRLAVPSGFTRLFSDAIATFARENPDVTLEIVSGARPVDLKKGEADLAIRASTIVDKDLIARKLFDSGFALYGSETYFARKPAPRDVNDLSGHDIVGFPEVYVGNMNDFFQACASAFSFGTRTRSARGMILYSKGVFIKPTSPSRATEIFFLRVERVIESMLIVRKSSPLFALPVNNFVIERTTPNRDPSVRA